MADPKDVKPEQIESAEEVLDAKALKIERDRLAEQAKNLEKRLAASQELQKAKPKAAPGKGTPYALMHIVGHGRRDVKPGEELLRGAEIDGEIVDETIGLSCKREFTPDERNSPTFHLAPPAFHYEMR